MDVGKIVLTPAVYKVSGNHRAEESVTVRMAGNTIRVGYNSEYPPTGDYSLTPAQAIELGQMLLKTAEIIPDYARALDAISEDQKRLEKRYRDMISGLGLDSEVEGTYTTVVDSQVP